MQKMLAMLRFDTENNHLIPKDVNFNTGSSEKLNLTALIFIFENNCYYNMRTIIKLSMDEKSNVD